MTPERFKWFMDQIGWLLQARVSGWENCRLIRLEGGLLRLAFEDGMVLEIQVRDVTPEEVAG